LLDTQLRTVVEVTGLRLATGEHEAEAVADPGGAAEVVAVPASSRAVLLTIAPAERRPILTEYLREQISAVLGLQPTQLEVTQPLAALGLNSLMTFELRNRLRVMYGAAISPQEFLAGITVEQIAGHVLAQLDTPAAPAIPQAASTPRPVALRRPDPGRVSTDPADWLVRGIPDPHAALRLFCLPYAGGNASLYRTWVGEAFEGIPRIEVCPIQLPGREQRHQEPAYTQMSSLVHTLGSVLRPYLQAPYALFGHSMGGLIAYELTRWLRRQGDAAPAHLYVSAARAPHLPDLEPPLHRLPEPQLIAKLRSMGGTPQELLGDPELMALYLPVLRADFALVETRIHHTEPPLDLPLTVFGGTHDDKVGPQCLAAWQSHTTAKFSVEMLAGDHFYLQRDPAGVLAALSASLHDTFLSAGDSES
jgi:surfactin synthase thioesterase subunit